jgi:hypothetical protein
MRRKRTAVKVYRGRREADGGCRVWIIETGRARPLPLRLDLDNHSPTGFEWGYRGSGPAQLALALLADALRRPARRVLASRFQMEAHRHLARDAEWTITKQEIVDYAAQKYDETG